MSFHKVNVLLSLPLAFALALQGESCRQGGGAAPASKSSPAASNSTPKGSGTQAVAHTPTATAAPTVAPTPAAGPAGASATAPGAGGAGAGGGTSLLEGSWGGQGIKMQVGGEGASIEFDCAQGRITQGLATDGGGRFSASGTYEEQRGGSERATGVRREDGTVSVRGPKSAGRPARFDGRVDAETMTMTLAVTFPDGRPSPGTFTLVRGAPPRLRKCR